MGRKWISIAVVGLLTAACVTPTGDSDSTEPAAPTAEPTTETVAPTAEPTHPSVAAEPSLLPSGPFGPLWQMDPAAAFQHPASCKNLSGLPTMEMGENVAWRIWWPSDWSAQESLTGECMWFGPEPWESDIDASLPPDEVAIAIRVLDGRVTPTSSEFEGGSVQREERFTVAGVPAVRYEVAGSDGQLLDGDGVIWVVGAEGELPVFGEGNVIPNYISVFTSSPDAGRLAEQADVLDRMVATLKFLDR